MAILKKLSIYGTKNPQKSKWVEKEIILFLPSKMKMDHPKNTEMYCDSLLEESLALIENQSTKVNNVNVDSQMTNTPID